MTVVKAVYGSWMTLTGTMAEVGAALNNERADPYKVVNIVYDGTLDKYVAILKK